MRDAYFYEDAGAVYFDKNGFTYSDVYKERERNSIRVAFKFSYKNLDSPGIADNVFYCNKDRHANGRI